MQTDPQLVLLGGARETRRVAACIAETGVAAALLWSDSATRRPVPLPVLDARPRSARGWLDVTHAFDTRTRAALPAAPYARVARPPWQPGPRSRWQSVATLADAVVALPAGATVFAATGRQSLPTLAQHDGTVFVRQLQDHGADTGFDRCRFVFGAPPFDVAQEVALFQRLGVDVVLARHVGGPGSFPKIAAADTLGLEVVLIAPPAVPVGPTLYDAAEIQAWARAL